MHQKQYLNVGAYDALRHSACIYYDTARAARLGILPDFTLSGVALNVVDNCKYSGHIISSVNDDNQDIARQMSLLC